MSGFSSFDYFEHVPGTRKTYVLTQTLRWHIGCKGSDWLLAVEAGTVFDISVPWTLEWLQSPHDRRVLLAAAIHDELLKRGHDVAFASAEFRRALLARGCSPPRAWALFTATLIWTAFGRFFRA
ncbi:DUF1353 domain-containing protein [Roseibium sediminis]|uniref:DUF1353 domain-containing protein n=1 Tax=Roseibium sediminis TaxID=1775174 RepID=UPI00123CB30C|nr:DUF1353 domain-containing protein [Roseibium sediminis]